MKPLFESGTLGTAANTVVVLPGKTSSYSQGVVAGEGQGIAMCTLTNFPALPLHCIEWGRLMFGDHFVSGAQKAAAFLEDPKKWLNKSFDNTSQQLDEFKQVKYWLELSKKPTIELCTQLAFEQFHKQFRDKITVCSLEPRPLCARSTCP
jgi:ubiquitin-activating enzyme E1